MLPVQLFGLSDGRDGLGLTCDHRGLDLAGIQLLHWAGGRFQPRPRDHLEQLLTKAYRAPVDTGSVARGLRAVAEALNEGEIARAMIAAVQLRLPPLDWHGAVRILRAENALAKDDYNPDEPRDWHGRWTTGGGAGPAPPAAPGPAQPSRLLAEQSPPSSTEQPSLPSPPLVHGRFPAPSGASPSPLYHPVGGAEEDENGRGGLLDFRDPLREFFREEYELLRAQLRAIDPRNPQLQTLTSPEYSPSEEDVELLRDAVREAQEGVGEPPSIFWLLGWAARGIKLELLRLGGPRKFPFNTPVIDDFAEEGVATSIKSIDLNAPSYRILRTLSKKIDGYVDELRSFERLNWGGFRIYPHQIKAKVLDLIVPRNSGSRMQMDTIKESIDRARDFGVIVRVFYY